MWLSSATPFKIYHEYPLEFMNDIILYFSYYKCKSITIFGCWITFVVLVRLLLNVFLYDLFLSPFCWSINIYLLAIRMLVRLGMLVTGLKSHLYNNHNKQMVDNLILKLHNT